jgi:adenosylcobinamide kinase/adenosylcobinamide-phosphate guanylyltransferase
VIASGRAPVYIATGTAGDTEMAERIALHRARRGEQWRTVEAPLDLAGALTREAGEGYYVLVDCLTLWVTNLMVTDRNIEEEAARLLEVLAQVAGPVVIVSGEVGLGVVPGDRLSRRFADALGNVNQRVAAVVDRVVLVAAGLPLVLKAEQTNIEAAEI